MALRIKMECPTCGYKSFPQWLNDKAHCLKCDAVLKTRSSCNEGRSSSTGAAVRRLSAEVSTFRQPASSAMESVSGTCGTSPDGTHHWKFGKCNYCQCPEGQSAHGATSLVAARCAKFGQTDGRRRQRAASLGVTSSRRPSQEGVPSERPRRPSLDSASTLARRPSLGQSASAVQLPSAFDDAVQHKGSDASRVQLLCPTCGFRSFPQWLNNAAHCLKCDAVLQRRASCHDKQGSANRQLSNAGVRVSGEASTFKQSPSSAMESESGRCAHSPDGNHHWKFGKCSYCQMPEGRIAKERGTLTYPAGENCAMGGQCLFKFAKCTKCGRGEYSSLMKPGSRNATSPEPPSRRSTMHAEVNVDYEEEFEADKRVAVGGGLRAVRKLLSAKSCDESGDDNASTADGSDEDVRVIRRHSSVSSDGQEVRRLSSVSSEAFGTIHSRVKNVFSAFCGSSPDMDGRTFAKLCKDCGLFDKRFTSASADLMFTKVVKNSRRLSWAGFEELLRLVAEKKGMEYDDVYGLVSGSNGPVLLGTRAAAVRFHDDKTTYTGTHVNGGPEAVPK